MQTPSFGPEDEGLLVLPSEDELLEAVVENEMDGGVELKDAEETSEMENLEQAAAGEPQDEGNLQAGGQYWRSAFVLCARADAEGAPCMCVFFVILIRQKRAESRLTTSKVSKPGHRISSVEYQVGFAQQEMYCSTSCTDSCRSRKCWNPATSLCQSARLLGADIFKAAREAALFTWPWCPWETPSRCRAGWGT